MVFKNISRIFQCAGVLVFITFGTAIITTMANANLKIGAIKQAPVNANGCPATLDFKLKSLASTDLV